eukprot:6478961-Amphidinium_carterae.2
MQSTVILSPGQPEYYGIVKAMAMGFVMRSRLAVIGIELGALVRGALQDRSTQTRLHELSLNANDWDDRNTTMSDGCAFKTKCLLKRLLLNP